MPALLLILTGLPYSGKTTLARALEQKGAAVVELDHINRERGFRIEDGVPFAEWPETIRQAEARIGQHLVDGVALVVLSWVNPTNRDRERWQAFASAQGMEHHLVYLAADEPLLTSRRATADSERHKLADDVIQRVKRRFQAPTDATTVQASWPIEQQVDAVAYSPRLRRFFD
ncbi:AAA family ATPase [Kribbella sp. WER1]